MRRSRLSKVKFSSNLLLATAIASIAIPAFALPIGFGVNQGTLRYSEIRNDDFIVYHDERTPEEGRLAMASLIAAKPHLEQWMSVKRDRRLPVIMSAVTENASFANFITDAIELQTMGQGPRDLFWHEYVHSTMYRHFDNWFGPAGAVIHLPWMPAWFIEGLAEALSVSVGSDVQAGIERYQALTGDWPSYDRLHSLYGKGGFALRGYATSGAFVAWILRHANTAGNDSLPMLLREFYHKSMPWWWPWAAVPFNSFMPMDAALEKIAKESGEKLYERYKTEATTYWRQKTANLPAWSIERTSPRRLFTSISSMQSNGDDLWIGARDDNGLIHAQASFDEKTGWATTWDESKKTAVRLPEQLESWSRIIAPDMNVTVVGEKSALDPMRYKIRIAVPGKRLRSIPRGTATIAKLWRHQDIIMWLEYDHQLTRLCRFTGGKAMCDEYRQPITLAPLGARPDGSEIWLTIREQSVHGDEFALAIWTPDGKLRRLPERMKAQPLSLAFVNTTAENPTSSQIFLLSAGRSMRALSMIDPQGKCIGATTMADYPSAIFGFASGDLAIAFYDRDLNSVRRFAKSHLKTAIVDQLKPDLCDGFGHHASPLLAAVQSSQPIQFTEALAQSDIWTDGALSSASRVPNNNQSSVPTVDLSDTSVAREAAWRGRPVLAFPWIGADDALGPQIGAVSVPLMDHMQNETIRFTALYGVASRYPNTELSLVSNRFTPTLTLTGFRQQTYNGQFRRIADDEIVVSYLDERGARFEVSQPFRWYKSSLNIDAGWKTSRLDPYLGPTNVRHGTLSEPYITITQNWSPAPLSWTNSFSGRIAPKSLNKDFDYNVAGVASTVSRRFSWLSSRLDLGLEASRTRGPKRRELQEVYRPLKTFIAGSGGGYNQNSFLLAGEGGLFTPRFSNTQARAKVNYTLPVLPNLDKLIWIFYLERLDFSAFWNRGGAWRGDNLTLPRSYQLVTAHGYNLDLSLDNKGVRFNAGLGTGQVLEQPWQVYGSFGFDALF